MTTRRTFIRQAAAGITTGAAISSGALALAEPTESPYGDRQGETVILGKTGLAVRRIGLGAAHFTKDRTEDEAARFIHAVFDAGVNLIDTAWNYGSEQGSWRCLGKALKDLPRDEIILSNKLEHFQNRSISHRSVNEQIDEALTTMGVDHFDLYLIHNLRDTGDAEKFIANGTVEKMLDARDRGKVRHIGTSAHNHSEIIKLCKHYPEIEVVLGGMNVMREYFWFGGTDTGLHAFTRRHNIGMMVMKPFLMGNLTANRPSALSYVLGRQGTVPIPGMSEYDHIEMNLRTAREFASLSADEQRRKAEPDTLLECRSCDGCGFCVTGEEVPVNVPQLVMAAQYGERFGLGKWQSLEQRTGTLADDLSMVTPELAKRAELRCPGELPVRELLKKCEPYI